MLQRFLDWIDEAASSLIRLTYLLAGITAVAVYFGAGHLPGYIEEPLNAMLPWLLAFSVETHTYLTARRVSKNWSALGAPALEKTTRRTIRNDLLVNIGILGLLVSFSIWNQLNYLLVTWTPASNNLIPIAPIIQLVVRASIVPLFFMALAFMAPQARSIGETLNAEAHAILRKFLKLLKDQTKAQEKIIRSKPSINLGNAIRAVAAAANEKKSGDQLAAVQEAMAIVASGGTPAEASEEAFGQPSAQTVKMGSVEDRVRRVYRKGMTAKTLASKAGCSLSTAKRWINKFEPRLKLVS